MRRKSIRMAMLFLCAALLTAAAPRSFAEKMFSVLATVDAIDLETKSMQVMYTDPETNSLKKQAVYWDQSTEFIREGLPPDFKEEPAKAADIKQGSRLYIRITASGQKMGRLRLDAVRIKPDKEKAK
jgi:hypothetical protein